MINVKDVDGNDFVIDGRAELDDEYPNICCQGHMWAVVYIVRDANVAYDSLWGVCRNLDCPVEKDSHYQGVSCVLAEDVALKLLEPQEGAQP